MSGSTQEKGEPGPVNPYRPGVLFVGIGFFVGFEHETVSRLLNGGITADRMIDVVLAILGYILITAVMYIIGEVLSNQMGGRDRDAKVIRYLKTFFTCVAWAFVVYVIVERVN